MKLFLKFFSLAFLVFLAGCDVYDEGFDISQAIDKCEQAGGNCVDPTGANLLALSFSNSGRNTLKNSNYCSPNCVFDVSGLCNEADFAQHYLEFRVHNVNSNTTYTNLTRVPGACKRGKFRIQVPVHAGCVLQSQVLTVEIVGLDLEGNEHRNPLAARRSVEVLFIKEGAVGTPPTCPIT